MSKHYIRTTGHDSQPEFDNLISDLDISSLRFLDQKYAKDLHYFRSHNDLNDQMNAQTYKEMQQRKKMIEEELSFRENFYIPDTEVLYYYPSVDEDEEDE